MRKHSRKSNRVNSEVQKELSNIIRGGLKDPRIAPMTSVVATEVTTDLKTCKAYISVLGEEKVQAETLAGLQSAEGFIRRELARNLNLRNTPTLQFILDQSIEYGVTMTKKIEDIVKDIKDEAEAEGAGEMTEETTEDTEDTKDTKGTGNTEGDGTE